MYLSLPILTLLCDCCGLLRFLLGWFHLIVLFFRGCEETRILQSLEAFTSQAIEIDVDPFRFFRRLLAPMREWGATEATEVAFGMRRMVWSENTANGAMRLVGIQSVCSAVKVRQRDAKGQRMTC